MEPRSRDACFRRFRANSGQWLAPTFLTQITRGAYESSSCAPSPVLGIVKWVFSQFPRRSDTAFRSAILFDAFTGKKRAQKFPSGHWSGSAFARSDCTPLAAAAGSLSPLTSAARAETSHPDIELAPSVERVLRHADLAQGLRRRNFFARQFSSCRSIVTIPSGFSRFAGIADFPNYGTNRSQLVNPSQGATPADSVKFPFGLPIGRGIRDRPKRVMVPPNSVPRNRADTGMGNRLSGRSHGFDARKTGRRQGKNDCAGNNRGKWRRRCPP